MEAKGLMLALLLVAVAPMGELGGGLGVGALSTEQRSLGPELSLGYQHLILPAVHLRLSWSVLLGVDEGYVSGVRGGFGFALPADLMLGANLAMDSLPGDQGRAPVLAAGTSLSHTRAVGERLVLEYGLSGSVGMLRWSGGGLERDIRYRRAGAQLWFWPQRRAQASNFPASTSL